MQVIQQVFTNMNKSIQQEQVSINKNKSIKQQQVPTTTANLYNNSKSVQKQQSTQKENPSQLSQIRKTKWLSAELGQNVGERYTGNESPSSTRSRF